MDMFPAHAHTITIVMTRCGQVGHQIVSPLFAYLKLLSTVLTMTILPMTIIIMVITQPAIILHITLLITLPITMVMTIMTITTIMIIMATTMGIIIMAIRTKDTKRHIKHTKKPIRRQTKLIRKTKRTKRRPTELKNLTLLVMEKLLRRQRRPRLPTINNYCGIQFVNSHKAYIHN